LHGIRGGSLLGLCEGTDDSTLGRKTEAEVKMKAHEGLREEMVAAAGATGIALTRISGETLGS
jgi:hypothetical protein